jgi:hypothetical protein
MGSQQVLRAIAASVAIVSVAHAAPRHHRERPLHERAAIVDLGPADDGAARREIGAALVESGLEPVIGDGLDDALAGISPTADDAPLAVAISQAKQAFGELDCKRARSAADNAIGIAAARQAAGIAVPELPRAWAYVLLCADRTGDTDAAIMAATRMRATGGSPDVPAAVLAKYPDVDTLANREMVEVDVTADVPGAQLWVDFQPVGSAPAHLALAAGPHVIAAAAGTRRGWIAGTAVKTQKAVAIATTDQAGPHAALAARIAGWHGKVPAATELGAVLAEVHVRVAFVRHGNNVEVWGHAGLAEPVRLLGGADGTRPLAEVDRAVALAVDRAQTWNDRAPDPDQPLLVESQQERDARRKDVAHPTKWWVYAVIGAAVVVGGIVIIARDNASDTQQIQLHYP